jgi:hypothetical protein
MSTETTTAVTPNVLSVSAMALLDATLSISIYRRVACFCYAPTVL